MVDSAYLRYPHLCGDLLTFVADDDVWVAAAEGGRAWRFTAAQVAVSHPRFSPRGDMIAWTSGGEGVPEVFAAALDGGTAKRLTHWGDTTTSVRGWTPDGRVLAVSAVGEATRNRIWAWSVPLDGGPAERLPYGWASEAAISGTAVATVSSLVREPSSWKRYRGGRAGKIWVDAAGSREFTRLFPESTAQYWSVMWVGGRLAFLADIDGHGNVYSALPDGSDLRRHTSHEGFYARHATTDGSRVVYSRAGDLWMLESLDAEPRELPVRLGGSRPGRSPSPARNRVTAFSPDPAGRASAVEIQGTAHWVTHREGPATTLRDAPGVGVRLPRALGAGGLAVWVSDATGEDGLEVGRPGEEFRTLAAGRLGRVLELAASPDGEQVAVACHDGRLLVVEVESGRLHQLDRTEHGDIKGPAFSPDSRWLAWTYPHDERLSQIRMGRVDGGEVIEVTPRRFADFDPAFTRDGRHLAFLSHRTFDPVYDPQVLDLSFPHSCRPYVVPLLSTTAAPFGPGANDEAGTQATEVEIEGLAARVVPVPVPAGRYGNLRTAVGALLWVRRPLTGQLNGRLGNGADPNDDAVLERFDLTRRAPSELARKIESFEVSADGTQIVMTGPGGLQTRSTADRGDLVCIDVESVSVTVDPVASWRQAYAEAGRLMRDHFWRADMNGVDWQRTLARYAPLVERIGCYSELLDVLWEVQGELGTSHAYAYPNNAAAMSEYGRPPGLLGADLVRDDHLVWRVARILPGDSSDPNARSPLLAPGVAIRPGDAIIAVNGRAVDPIHGPLPLLSGLVGRQAELTVTSASDGTTRTVTVEPIGDERPLRYHDWVDSRRSLVRDLSADRLGYLHVPDMVASGWAQFHRDLRTEIARDGLIVDVRENGGGKLSELVLEKLSRRVTGWAVSRGHRPTPYPSDAPLGPVVGVTDEFAGSDGDIFSAGFMQNRLGPLVGTRTWGGVIGIDGRYSLTDGTMVTQPRYAFWLRGPGWSVENHGVTPDVEVAITPQDRVAGRDPQLERAVTLALTALTETPPASPPPLPPPAHAFEGLD
ncbi:S41 family peptidase [Streptosporangium sp. KLBMP 9127]|nr:PDZ domain-containing protein [Streptosporangium sp. KLBMP 9127]